MSKTSFILSKKFGAMLTIGVGAFFSGLIYSKYQRTKECRDLCNLLQKIEEDNKKAKLDKEKTE